MRARKAAAYIAILALGTLCAVSFAIVAIWPEKTEAQHTAALSAVSETATPSGTIWNSPVNRRSAVYDPDTGDWYGPSMMVNFGETNDNFGPTGGFLRYGQRTQADTSGTGDNIPYGMPLGFPFAITSIMGGCEGSTAGPSVCTLRVWTEGAAATVAEQLTWTFNLPGIVALDTLVDLPSSVAMMVELKLPSVTVDAPYFYFTLARRDTT